MKVKSGRRVSASDEPRRIRDRERTIEHGSALAQRIIHGEVYMARVGDDVILVRDSCQALDPGWALE